MNWKHGYYADDGYTFGYYPETSPLRLAWAALLQGHQTPTKRFRYLDAGCGQGLSLLLMASAHPDSEFVGIDFLPEHIAHATELAKACNLTNVRFIEGDFIELAKQPNSLGVFDYAVCHGITTWIAPPVKSALFELIGQTLKSGGLLYNSYNTFPGWLSASPFQHLVLLEQRTKPGSQALASARESMQRLQEPAAAFFGALPGLAARLKSMDAQDPAYLVQEYNNQFWQPVFVSQMMDEMAQVKLTYLGTATLLEAFETSYLPALRELIAAQPTAALREQLRDYGVNQAFRRDLYVKGRSRPWAGDLEQQVRAFQVTTNPMANRPEVGTNLKLSAGTIELAGDAKIYGSLLSLIDQHPEGVSVGELVDQSAQSRPWTVVVQTIAMMIHGGWVMFKQDCAPPTDGGKVNAALARAVCAGAPYRFISVPKAGGAQPMSDTEWFIFDAVLAGKPRSEWPGHALMYVKKLGRILVKDGVTATHERQQLDLLEEVSQGLENRRLPFFKNMGAI